MRDSFPAPQLYAARAISQSPNRRWFSASLDREASVAFQKSLRSSIQWSVRSPYGAEVLRMSCHSPAAPLCETARDWNPDSSAGRKASSRGSPLARTCSAMNPLYCLLLSSTTWSQSRRPASRRSTYLSMTSSSGISSQYTSPALWVWAGASACPAGLGLRARAGPCRRARDRAQPPAAAGSRDRQRGGYSCSPK